MCSQRFLGLYFIWFLYFFFCPLCFCCPLNFPFVFSDFCIQTSALLVKLHFCRSACLSTVPAPVLANHQLPSAVEVQLLCTIEVCYPVDPSLCCRCCSCSWVSQCFSSPWYSVGSPTKTFYTKFLASSPGALLPTFCTHVQLFGSPVVVQTPDSSPGLQISEGFQLCRQSRCLQPIMACY